MKYIAVLFFSLFLVSPVYADELAGLWETDSDTYVYFKEDGTFSFINSKTRTGYSWQRTGENSVLFFRSRAGKGMHAYFEWKNAHCRGRRTNVHIQKIFSNRHNVHRRDFLSGTHASSSACGSPLCFV